jgi:hypothetical protein
MIETVFAAVLGLSQDGACTDLVENLSENILKGDLSLKKLAVRLIFELSKLEL